ncbi:hypothetical protein IJ541_01020 [bacterium]|nr:hypothetical protein [bacterium]
MPITCKHVGWAYLKQCRPALLPRNDRACHSELDSESVLDPEINSG